MTVQTLPFNPALSGSSESTLSLPQIGIATAKAIAFAVSSFGTIPVGGESGLMVFGNTAVVLNHVRVSDNRLGQSRTDQSHERDEYNRMIPAHVSMLLLGNG